MTKKKSGYVSKRMKVRAAQRRKKRVNQLIIAVIVLAIAVSATWAFSTREKSPANTAQQSLASEVSVDQAYELYEEGAFVLDVRTQGEWDDFHIPGTTLIPLDELESRVDEVPRDQDVVVVCRSGNRSQVGRDILRAAGFERVTSMDGGVSTWREAGYPTE